MLICKEISEVKAIGKLLNPNKVSNINGVNYGPLYKPSLRLESSVFADAS